MMQIQNSQTAIVPAPAATLPNPKYPAMIAMIRNKIAQYNTRTSKLIHSYMQGIKFLIYKVKQEVSRLSQNLSSKGS